MITSLLVFEGTCFDPHYNLAVEQALLESVKEGQCILYLWQNENTVVIGKNQNPWKECKTALLQQEGGKLARRLSGGGAVFHDLGNLNFTFLMPRSDYCLDKQLNVIQSAVQSLGIAAERSGRNDILAVGRKFSGNAFYINGNQAYHHGTLLVDADLEKLNRYLSPSKAKLQSKGVDSVRSRVINLKERNREITIDILKKALVCAFSQTYALPAEQIGASALDPFRVEELTARNQSWEWIYGRKIPFTIECEECFPWGAVQIQLQVENGVIQQARIYSDAMDWTFAPELERKLKGFRFDRHDLENYLRQRNIPAENDILQLLIRNLRIL